MGEKLFFSQELINSWADDPRIQFENNTLTIETPRGVQHYTLSSAYRILCVSDGSSDPHGLVNTVRTQEELDTLGADVYLNSCILGETPYDLEPGYVAQKAEDEENINKLLEEYLLEVWKDME